MDFDVDLPWVSIFLTEEEDGIGPADILTANTLEDWKSRSFG